MLADKTGQGLVFPAQAGVIPGQGLDVQFFVSIPRASGGDPWKERMNNGISKYSPRKRG